ncbi:protein FAM200C-like [Lepeophtheirus salmonis]|uniref:protein FAM200C-like n=1 Tax=Lepeophtheirus salmonis TaxID=72036 RepID=UPI001AE1ED23|nr:zinc finger BED domain-containing protein 5-like [Lepeophtheirus salmonis]
MDKGEFAEEMLFCKSLETTTSAADIYSKLINYLRVNNIPMENIISCAADGAPVMMGKKKGCLKLMKDDTPEMIIVHCVIHRENLVAKNITPPLNEVLHSVIKCINAIKASAKCRFQRGNCLKRFMVLYDILSVFLSDKPEMNHLVTVDGKTFVSYLTDIFEKLNMLNKQLQGSNITFVDAKTNIFGCVTFIEACQENISH